LNKQQPSEVQTTSSAATTQSTYSLPGTRETRQPQPLAALPAAKEAPVEQHENKPSLGAVASWLPVGVGATIGCMQRYSEVLEAQKLGGAAMLNFFKEGHYHDNTLDIIKWMDNANKAGMGGDNLVQTVRAVSEAGNNSFLTYLGPAAAAASAGHAIVGLIKDVAAISKGEKVDARQLAASGVKVLRAGAGVAGMTNPAVTAGLLAAQAAIHYSDPKTLQKLQAAQKSIEGNQQKQGLKGWGKTLSDLNWVQTTAQLAVADTIQRTGAKVKEMVGTGMQTAQATLPSGQNNPAPQLAAAPAQFALPAGKEPLPFTPENQIKPFERPSPQPDLEAQFMLAAAAHQRG
jgi:hypothetical protein